MRCEVRPDGPRVAAALLQSLAIEKDAARLTDKWVSQNLAEASWASCI
jgi:hypothetical protein